MPKRKRRRGQQAYVSGDGRYPWLSTPVVLAFSLGSVVGFVLAFLGFFGLAIVFFLLAFSVSHLVARRLSRRRDPQQRAQETATRSEAPQRTAGER